MIMKNKLGINNSLILAREEERITKIKCKQLFDSNVLNQLEVGTFCTLQFKHKYLFEDIYEFARKIRNENISKGNFRFASLMYLTSAFF